MRLKLLCGARLLLSGFIWRGRLSHMRSGGFILWRIFCLPRLSCSTGFRRLSLGHSNATQPETLAGIAAGATSATHTYNAMRALNHREPGILGTVLDDERLFAELICDGVHVVPELIRLWLKAKGADKAILVTDSMSAAGMPEGTYRLGTFEVT